MEKKTLFSILVLVLLAVAALVSSQISGPSNWDGLNFYYIQNATRIQGTNGTFTRITVTNITITNPAILSNTHSHTFPNITGLAELNTTATNLVASNLSMDGRMDIVEANNATKTPYINPSANINWTSKNLTIQCLIFNSGGTICSTP